MTLYVHGTVYVRVDAIDVQVRLPTNSSLTALTPLASVKATAAGKARKGDPSGSDCSQSPAGRTPTGSSGLFHKLAGAFSPTHRRHKSSGTAHHGARGHGHKGRGSVTADGGSTADTGTTGHDDSFSAETAESTSFPVIMTQTEHESADESRASLSPTHRSPTTRPVTHRRSPVAANEPMEMDGDVALLSLPPPHVVLGLHGQYHQTQPRSWRDVELHNTPASPLKVSSQGALGAPWPITHTVDDVDGVELGDSPPIHHLGERNDSENGTATASPDLVQDSNRSNGDASVVADSEGVATMASSRRVPTELQSTAAVGGLSNPPTRSNSQLPFPLFGGGHGVTEGARKRLSLPLGQLFSFEGCRVRVSPELAIGLDEEVGLWNQRCGRCGRGRHATEAVGQKEDEAAGATSQTNGSRSDDASDAATTTSVATRRDSGICEYPYDTLGTQDILPSSDLSQTPPEHHHHRGAASALSSATSGKPSLEATRNTLLVHLQLPWEPPAPPTESGDSGVASSPQDTPSVSGSTTLGSTAGSPAGRGSSAGGAASPLSKLAQRWKTLTSSPAKRSSGDATASPHARQSMQRTPEFPDLSANGAAPTASQSISVDLDRLFTVASVVAASPCCTRSASHAGGLSNDSDGVPRVAPTTAGGAPAPRPQTRDDGTIATCLDEGGGRPPSLAVTATPPMSPEVLARTDLSFEERASGVTSAAAMTDKKTSSRADASVESGLPKHFVRHVAVPFPLRAGQATVKLTLYFRPGVGPEPF